MDENQIIQTMVDAAHKSHGVAPDDAMSFLAKYLERHGATMDPKDYEGFIQAGAAIWCMWQGC